MKGAAAAIAMVATSIALFPAPVGAARSNTTAPVPARAPASRLLVLSLPAVSWVDVRRQIDTPSRPRGLARVLDGAGVADLSLRSVQRHTTAGEGYATLGAGTRTAGAIPVDSLAFDGQEVFENGPASVALARRTGSAPPPGAIAALNVPPVQAANRRLLFGSEPGALGTALRAAGVRTAVVANADTSLTDTADSAYGRTAALGIADGHGVVDGGEVSRSLLRAAPDSPFGVALDPAAVTDAVRAASGDRSVVLLEASDLVRADAARPFTAPGERREMVDDALDHTAAILDRLIESDVVNLTRDAVIVVGPVHSTARVNLAVFAGRRPGLRAGLLRSPTTRRSGIVTLVDVAPTILDWMGVARPDSMEGRPIAAGARGGDARARLAMLIRTNVDAQARDRLVAPVTVVFVVGQALLSVIAVALLGRARRGRRALEIAALTFFGFLTATYLAAPLRIAARGAGAYFAFTVGFGVALALAARFAGRARDMAPPAMLLATVVGLFAIDMATGSRLQLNAVLGYSPTVGGRFAGIGNLAFAQLSVAAILLAGIVANERAASGVRWAAIVLGCAVIVDGLPMWGSDVGGVLSLVPAGTVTLLSLQGRRVRLRTIAILATSTLAAVAVATAVDLLRPAQKQTHLGRLAESIRSDGGGALSRVVQRKLEANLSVLTTSIWTLLVPAVLLFIAYLVYRSPGRLRIIAERAPALRASFAGVLTVGVLGFGLNDSGIAVPALMLGMLNPVLVFLAARWT